MRRYFPLFFTKNGAQFSHLLSCDYPHDSFCSHYLLPLCSSLSLSLCARRGGAACRGAASGLAFSTGRTREPHVDTRIAHARESRRVIRQLILIFILVLVIIIILVVVVVIIIFIIVRATSSGGRCVASALPRASASRRDRRQRVLRFRVGCTDCDIHVVSVVLSFFCRFVCVRVHLCLCNVYWWKACRTCFRHICI
jgi:hypothetical protein